MLLHLEKHLSAQWVGTLRKEALLLEHVRWEVAEKGLLRSPRFA